MVLVGALNSAVKTVIAPGIVITANSDATDFVCAAGACLFGCCDFLISVEKVQFFSPKLPVLLVQGDCDPTTPLSNVVELEAAMIKGT